MSKNTSVDLLPAELCRWPLGRRFFLFESHPAFTGALTPSPGRAAMKARHLSHADCVSVLDDGPTFLENVHADRQGCKLRSLSAAIGTETTSVVPKRLARPSTALGRSPQSRAGSTFLQH
jgi:hypothetical protein